MKYRLDSLIQQAMRAHELAVRHNLADRLKENALTEFQADIKLLQSLGAGISEVRRQAMASTAAQAAAIKRGCTIARGVRALIRRAGAPRDVCKRYGAGALCTPESATQVVSLINQILARAEAEPEEATSFGIVQEDRDRLRQALADIQNADKEQRELAIKSPQTTAERDAVAERVSRTIHRIVGAGMARFANQPAALEFQALGALGRKRKATTTDGSTSTINPLPTTTMPATQNAA